jgi:hypothetical protein
VRGFYKGMGEMIWRRLVPISICAVGVTLVIIGAVTQAMTLNAVLDFSLPTRSCPHGAIPPFVHIDSELGKVCAEEREELYLPTGLPHMPRYSFWGVILSSVALICVWIKFKGSSVGVIAICSLGVLFATAVIWVVVIAVLVPDIPDMLPGPDPLKFPW